MSWLSSFFKGPQDNSAELARQAMAEQRAAEDARQKQVREGQAGIDTAFSQFDPAYYDKFRQSYVDTYNPQIAQQYDRAKDKMTATLAGRGVLESTVGASKFGDLTKTRADAEADIGSHAVDAAGQVKSKVDNAKAGLYAINLGASDPALTAARAIGEATSIAAPPALSPLGQVFQSAAQSFSNFNKADARSMNPSMPWNTYSSSAPLSGRGSSLFG